MKQVYLFFTSIMFCFLTQKAKAQELLMYAEGITNGLNVVTGYENYALITSFQMGALGVDGSANNTGPNLTLAAAEITKNVDLASNRLLRMMPFATPIDDIIFVWVSQTESGYKIVHKVELREVYVTSAQNSSVTGTCIGQDCAVIAESFKLAYRSIRKTSYTKDERNVYRADALPFLYNSKTRKAEF